MPSNASISTKPIRQLASPAGDFIKSSLVVHLSHAEALEKRCAALVKECDAAIAAKDEACAIMADFCKNTDECAALLRQGGFATRTRIFEDFSNRVRKFFKAARKSKKPAL